MNEEKTIDDLIAEMNRVKAQFVKKRNETKVCKKCGKEKPYSEFAKNPYGKNGIENICKACKSKVTKDWAIKNPERKKQAILAFQQKRKEKTKTLAQKEFYRALHDFNGDVLGGYKIFILNHVRGNEKKYNIVRTDGRVFLTNDRAEFLQFLEKRV